MEGLLAARIVSMICLGLVTWVVGEDRGENINMTTLTFMSRDWCILSAETVQKILMQCPCFFDEPMPLGTPSYNRIAWKHQ